MGFGFCEFLVLVMTCLRWVVWIRVVLVLVDLVWVYGFGLRRFGLAGCWMFCGCIDFCLVLNFAIAVVGFLDFSWFGWVCFDCGVVLIVPFWVGGLWVWWSRFGGVLILWLACWFVLGC